MQRRNSKPSKLDQRSEQSIKGRVPQVSASQTEPLKQQVQRPLSSELCRAEAHAVEMEREEKKQEKKNRTKQKQAQERLYSTLVAPRSNVLRAML